MLGGGGFNNQTVPILVHIYPLFINNLPKCTKNMYILGYLGGPDGVFNDQTGPILLSRYPLTHIYVHVK